MITKEKLKAHIDKLPEDEFTMDESIDRLVFIERLEERMRISKKTDSGISEEEVKEEIEKWSK